MTSMEERLERIRRANAGKPRRFPKRDLPPAGAGGPPDPTYRYCAGDGDYDDDPEFLR